MPLLLPAESELGRGMETGRMGGDAVGSEGAAGTWLTGGNVGEGVGGTAEPCMAVVIAGMLANAAVGATCLTDGRLGGGDRKPLTTGAMPAR